MYGNVVVRVLEKRRQVGSNTDKLCDIVGDNRLCSRLQVGCYPLGKDGVSSGAIVVSYLRDTVLPLKSRTSVNHKREDVGREATEPYLDSGWVGSTSEYMYVSMWC